MLNVSAHQQPRYYQPNHNVVPTTAWIAAVMWYSCCKEERNKILQNIWFTEVYIYIYSTVSFSLFICPVYVTKNTLTVSSAAV